MSERAWKLLVFSGFAFVFFILTLVVIRWTIDFVTWSNIDSGWAQTIGSVASVLAAIWIMSRQFHQQERQVRRDFLKNLQQIFGALQSEIRVYKIVAESRIHHPTAIFHPETARFPVFDAYAASIGNVSDPRVRDNILMLYRNIDVFISSSNHLSGLGRLMKTEDPPSRHTQEEVAAIGPAVRNHAIAVLNNIETVDADLAEAIRTVEQERMRYI